jgi:hypothetical protein
VVTGQLEDSLRHEIETYIEGRLSSIKQEISELQSQLNDSLTRLLDRQAEVQMDGSLAASILEHLRTAHENGVALAASESSRAKASSDMAIVKAGIEEVYQQHSQADILKTLVNRASSFAPRVAFFVIKGTQANGWRGRGFEGTVGDRAIQEISLSTDGDTIVGSVSRSKTTFSGSPGSHQEDHVLLNQLGDEPPQRIVGVPLTVRGRSVAVLYADSAGLDSEAINLEALETLVRVAGMAVELVSVSRAPKAVQETVHQDAEAKTGYTPTREYEEPTPVTPVAPEVPPVVEQAPPAPTLHADPVPEPEVFETKKAPAPEPVRPDPLPTIPVEAPVASSRRRVGMDSELPVSVNTDEERRFHNDARRFARLLVSEIKLYNEQKVLEGRSNNDLYERLKEYIDRSREMYDKRVKPDVALRFDYFHHELVNTLAEGQSERLGASYPGATVNA